MANFRSLAAFAQFGSDLDKETQRQLERGRRLTEVLKQPQYQPTPLVEQVVLIFAGTRGMLDKVDVDRVKEWEESFVRFLRTQYSDVVEGIETDLRLSEEVEARLKEAIANFNSTWS
jgi:F-type H+-transporting ATPase subunit alpha